tara:strand:+ start:126 stop:566 length:441 start_codon:yes stop_codon:yes gene_type:complete
MSTLLADTIRKTGGTAGVDIRVKNTSVYESDGGTSVTQNLVQSLAKAWWQMNGSGTVAFGDSFNSASITDHATGDYSVSNTNNMGNATYAALGSCGRNGDSYVGGDCEMPGQAATTSSTIRFFSYNYDAGTGDVTYISGQLSGDLA